MAGEKGPVDFGGPQEGINTMETCPDKRIRLTRDLPIQEWHGCFTGEEFDTIVFAGGLRGRVQFLSKGDIIVHANNQEYEFVSGVVPVGHCAWRV